MTPAPDRMAATRTSYDAVAGAYADALSDELRRKPLDRALLTAFAEQVRPAGAGQGRVWDALPAPDGSRDGLVSFYSLIHMIDDADLRAALAEYRRVLTGDGLLLLAVHAGQEVRHHAEWFGAEVDVSFRFFDPLWLRAELEQAAFAIEALTFRQPYPDAEVATPRAYFLARAR